VLTKVGDTPSRPLWIGAVSGAVLILIVESVVSIMVISAMDRRRNESDSSPGFQESPGSC